MTEVEFIYNGTPTIIHCNTDETIDNICQRFEIKLKLNKNNIYYLYSGQNLDRSKAFNEEANINDKERNKMSIIVMDIIRDEKKYKIKNKYIICPICKERIKIKFNNYKISLFKCKNNHTIKDMFYEDFEKTQYIDESSIICDICKINNKYDSYEKQFYICNTCNMNICPLCKLKHDNKHNIINYEQKEFICNEHNDKYNSYCNTCKKNLCQICEISHIKHEIKYYGKELIKKEDLEENLKELKDMIDKTNEKVIEMINRLSKTMKNFEYYYKIINDIINDYNMKNINYEILYNIKEINENQINIIDELRYIANCYSIHMNFENIIKINNLMNSKEDMILYKIDKKNNGIRIFDSDFVQNNKNVCKIEHDGKDYELQEYFDITNLKDKEFLEIKLKGIENITDMSSIFSCCYLLKYLPDISQWNTSNIINMRAMFAGCFLLENIPDISKWNTSNVTNMNCLFSFCYSLTSLPDISKWDISKVTDMSQMFNCCSSLKSFPDISQWDTSKVTDISELFSGSSSLTHLPDISKWNTSNVTNMYGMFNSSSLKSLPDISKWNTSNVTDMSLMFIFCSSLPSLPDISKWNTSKITNMNNMFKYCSSLISLPDISKWNTSNVKDMSFMFFGCSSLESLPDIAKWNTSKVSSMRYMFYKCESLRSLPDISKWNMINVENMSYMFSCCKSLISLPNISKWLTKEMNFMYNKMFSCCNDSLKIPSKYLKEYNIPEDKRRDYGKAIGDEDNSD